MKPLLILSLLTISAQAQNIYHEGWIDFNKNGVKDVYEDPAAPIEERVNDLLSQMNMEEKTCQLVTLYGSGRVLEDSVPTERWKNEVWKDGVANIDEQANGLGSFGAALSYPYGHSVDNRQKIQRWFVEETRLGIPVDFTNEGIRGICHDRATMMPAQCGQGATWDKNLISKIAEVTAAEAKALGYTNVYSPILDIAQDPRWGRCVESYGEDPYLVGMLGKEMVKGLQAQGLAATPKHFAVYSIPVGGRDAGTRTDPHVAPREMRTLYLEPFRRVMTETHPMGVMSSYNDYDGEPITGSYHFLTEILRGEFGFDGYVVSDSEAVEYLCTKHAVVPDSVEGAALCINAGLNVRTNFTHPERFVTPLREAVRRGLISSEIIDERVAQVLGVKFRLGLFDNPYAGDSELADSIVHTAEHQAVSLQAARESLVLLKNDGILPLSKDIKKIAVIGPNANENDNLICRYGPCNKDLCTVYEGISDLLPEAEVQYARGCDIIDKYWPKSELYHIDLDAEERAEMDAAVELARNSDVAIMVLGGNERTVREEYSRTSLDLCGRQEQLLREVYATGTPVVLVLVDGRAATINWADDFVPGILHAGFPGEFMGQAIAEALFGDYNPGGHLAVTFPKSVGQVPFAFPMKPGSDSEGFARVNGVLYPFGYGLSYTTFEFSDLELNAINGLPMGADSEEMATIPCDGSLKVSCRVTNTGDREGDEVVQLYLRDDVSSVTTYVRVLRGFERLHLAPGESKIVTFTLTPQDLALWDKEGNFTVEPGTFTIYIGDSSVNTPLEAKFSSAATSK